MKDDIVVTIAVAIFNEEEFVSRSLESIRKQTYQNIEIICIDDCSIDKTYAILKDFETDDSRAKIYQNTKNQGLAYSRNRSLELARGKYIMFVDGDDLMAADLVEKALKLAENKDADMVMWDYEAFVNDSEVNQKSKLESTMNSSKSDNKEYLLERPAFACTKLIKTAVARRLKIYFPLGLTRQDIPVHWHLITKLDKIEILPEKLSFYRQQPNATTAQSDQRLFDLITVTNIVKDYLKDNQLNMQYSDLINKQQLNFMFGVIDKIKPNLKSDAISLVKATMNIEHLDYLYSSKPMRWQARQYFKMKEGSIFSTIFYYCWFFTRRIYRTVSR
jgi:glycosyltransferase involved in cell wall biosynthesis